MITIRARTIDQQRALRMLLAVLNDSEPVVGQVIDEAAADEPYGVNGLLFGLLGLAAGAVAQASPEHAVEHVERVLVVLDQTQSEEP